MAHEYRLPVAVVYYFASRIDRRTVFSSVVVVVIVGVVFSTIRFVAAFVFMLGRGDQHMFDVSLFISTSDDGLGHVPNHHLEGESTAVFLFYFFP